jgi:2,3-bisphosphoglycerate-independent phosphoglycerate mutase
MNTRVTTALILCILDGWGESSQHEHNAIAQAHTPHWDTLRARYPHTVLQASEQYVGLPAGQMGNSEVGHMHLGAGRVLLQDLPRIDAAIASGELAKNQALLAHVAALKISGGTCHIMGLLSDGGVHAHVHHVQALAEIITAHGVPVRVHAFLDGRDTSPKSAQRYLEMLSPLVSVGTVCGRYFAMDRDKRWDRIQRAVDMLLDAKGDHAASAQQALANAYARGESDEFMQPCIIGDYAGMRDGDGVLMANFRADRARQLLHALSDTQWHNFPRRAVAFASLTGMTEYSETLAQRMTTLFPATTVSDGLGACVAAAGGTQLRIAETEKYAHVTFFFNGGSEGELAGESRILVPSPAVATYDLQPEMSAAEVTDALINHVRNHHPDLVVVNYANTDMVGHTGHLEATKQAVEAVDTCLGRLYALTQETGGALMITADHGNAESLHDASTHQAHTAHTCNPVPLLLAWPSKPHTLQLTPGSLTDIAPTALAIMGLAAPTSMTGKNLLCTEASCAL